MTSGRRRWALAAIAVAAVAALVAAALRWGDLRSGGSRVIVIGLDGADWELLDGYVAAGRMPNLAALQREGRAGVLRTFEPPLSPLLWTTMVTGVSPLQHRILDFTRFNPATGHREPITSDERMEKAVWEIANDAGRDVAVFGLWATHPAEPVRGLMVSDRLFAFLRREDAPAGVVHPAAESEPLLATRARVDADVSLTALQAYLPWLDKALYDQLQSEGDQYAHPVTMLRRILVETRLYHRVAFDWIAKHRPALSIVYFQGTDSIGHVFAAYAPPRQPEVTAADFDRYNHVPELYFGEIDALLGDYRRLADDTGAALVIVSDHGFRWREGRPVTSSGLAGATAALWHREQGIYVLSGRGIEPVAGRGEGEVGQVAATIVALLGLPRAAGTDGPALGGIAEVLPARDYGPRTRAPSSDTSAPSGEALSRLKALGYVGPSEPTTRAQGATGTRTGGSFHNEGVLLVQQKKTAEARAAFERALQLDPHLAAAKYSLAALLEAGGDSGRADELLLGALADGLAEGARRVEEIAFAAYRQGDVGRAGRLLDGAIGHEPDDWLLRIARGRLRIERRDCRGAFEDFDAARNLAPRQARAHGLAGTALMCLGRPAEARTAFEQSLALDPSQTRLRELLAGGR